MIPNRRNQYSKDIGAGLHSNYARVWIDRGMKADITAYMKQTKADSMAQAIRELIEFGLEAVK